LNYKKPVLVSGTDGVGTKLMLAIEAGKFDTIGIDCVAMCVNDVVAQGAEPLYFLDYVAVGKNRPEKLEQIVAGVAEGCVQAGAALIGGETAEMPDMYDPEDFDLAGFTVGIAEKDALLTPALIKEGDVLVGLPSSGIHSNGYSLVRKIFFKDNDYKLADKVDGIEDQELGDVLLTPTRIYVNALLPLIKKQLLHGVAHITGGGFVENVPRMLPDNVQAEIQLGSWPVLPIFQVMEKIGKIPALEMYEIFNMGIGMVLAVAPENLTEVLGVLTENDEKAYVIGSVAAKTSEKEVILKEAQA
jgi:phosphoribosylformylglycinamidine cyclo-ligase